MKKEHIYFNSLFDCYSSLLTEKEISCFINYYSDDLSLSEIAENNKVSRSAVQKTIKTVEEKLTDYEKKLRLLEINNLLNEALNQKDINEIKDIIDKIINN